MRSRALLPCFGDSAFESMAVLAGVVVLPALLGASAACGADSAPPGGSPPDDAFSLDGWPPPFFDTATPDATPQNPIGSGQSTSAMIGPEGGTLTLEGATLTIPAGALVAPTNILLVSRATPAPSGIVAWSPLFGFEPDGLQFLRPARVALPFAGDPERVVIFWSSSDGTLYERLGGVVEGATIAAEVRHFSSGAAGDGFAGSCAGASNAEPGPGGWLFGACIDHNGVCEPRLGEYCDLCSDCGPCDRAFLDGGRCGDRDCQERYEDRLLCPIDCAGCEWCGDQICTQGREWPATCPVDCAQNECGDGVCDPEREDDRSCPGDCAGEGFCGDGICDTSAGERLITCRSDCSGGRIDDGDCDDDENTYVTWVDCQNGWNRLECGDGRCAPDESEPCVCPDIPEGYCPAEYSLPYYYSPDQCPPAPTGGDPSLSARDKLAIYRDWACDERLTPNCARDPDGQFLCANKVVEFQLLLSNYKVDVFGVGQHQGLGIRRIERWYDSRTGDLCLVEGDEGPGDGIEKYIFNHGRTVNTDMRIDALGRQRRNYLIIAKQEVTIDGIDLELVRRMSSEIAGIYPLRSLESCMAAIPDGFCDHECGNDGYTLPAALIFTDERDCEGPVLTPKDAHLPENRQPGDPPACARRPGSFDKTIPLWGHNSNNDADAARAFFMQCSSALREDGEYRTIQDWRDRLAPEICATYCDSSEVAEACITPHNIAKLQVEWCDGCMRLPTGLDGDRWSLFPAPIADCYNRDWIEPGSRCTSSAGECPFLPGKKAVKGF